MQCELGTCQKTEREEGREEKERQKRASSRTRNGEGLFDVKISLVS